ncbi:hypothetical protein IC232_03385 [Microvirga sp. BT688]|uniref:hypothetical protein n=1 Tax=Microvirga sp. TaxID=1873136 RepID=UPI0016827070|nr:hypothetical protein [Microvirga sp.]MBD2745732.1 hypothetical protein [Microvirga sp.]
MNPITPRSNRVEVRNPVLGLPAFRRILDLPAPEREALSALLDDLSKDALEKAETSWRKKKGPMAAYWKATSVYSQHCARAIRKSGRSAIVSSANIEKPTTPVPYSSIPSSEAMNENQDNSARAA